MNNDGSSSSSYSSTHRLSSSRSNNMYSSDSTRERYFPYPNPSPDPVATSSPSSSSHIIYIILPILVVLSTLLLLLLIFLVAIIWVKRRQGVRLIEEGGPLDLSRSDGVIGEGGIEGVESRWLEGVSEDVREGYRRGRDYQLQYPPASAPTDITLSQFLSIQEKGVSAWCFEPDYESVPSLFVESRTEITFLQDGPGMTDREGGGNTVLANLPVPKLNDVYYWEAKMYEKPPGTEVSIGLATKPYPSFRLPGWNKVSVGYFSSDGFKCHNYPFTAASHGPPLKEGDVLGVGYRPRSGTVFFTKNGRKLDDCYTGLASHNLFPAIGANGACSIHVNLGQSGFVFIEANVRKWGLAPMTGTLAPPPAYGSERGSILLDAGYGVAGSVRSEDAGAGALVSAMEVGSPSTPSYRRATRVVHRRGESLNALGTSVPVRPSPLRAAGSSPSSSHAGPSSLPQRRLGPSAQTSDRYNSPTDQPDVPSRRFPSSIDSNDPASDGDDGDLTDDSNSVHSGEMYTGAPSPSISSPGNPPTPHMMDISLHTLHDHANSFGGRGGSDHDSSSHEDTARDEREQGQHARHQYADETRRQRRHREEADRQSRAMYAARLRGVVEGDQPPPGYAPLDPNVYSDGVPTDLPAELISQAFENAALNEPRPPRQQPRAGWSIGRILSTALDGLQGVQVR